jgi:hypothetical protein
VALTVVVGTALLLTTVAGDRYSLASRHHWVAVAGAIIVPGVLVGRLVAAWLGPPRRTAPRDEVPEGRKDDHRHR